MLPLNRSYLPVLRTAALLAPLVLASPTLRAEPATTNSGVPMPATVGNVPIRNTRGLKTAIVAATDTSGDPQMARRALLAANVALSRRSEFALMPISDTLELMKNREISYPFSIQDYQAMNQKGKLPRALMVEVSPDQIGDDSAGYLALVELYDTATGGLVGRGTGSFTATPGNTRARATGGTGAARNGAGVASEEKTLPDAGDVPVPTTQELQMRAVDGAIFEAIADMSRPAQLSGIVVSRPMGYGARLSLGERNGLRNGAQIEYLGIDGQPVAYGTVIDLGMGEAVATIAPEAAIPQIFVNMPFRTSSNPPIGRAGLSANQLDDREWNQFERQFAISLAIAGVIYYLAQ